MAAAAAGANRYPDMGTQQLRTALGAHLDLDPDRIAVGCGSSALCQQLVQITCTPGDEVIFAWRSFEAYPIFAQVVGARPVKVPLDAAGKHDLDAMAQAITPRTRLIFVCNPNNPSGTTITQAEFAQFMARVPDNVLVALDEAYTEFTATRTPRTPAPPPRTTPTWWACGPSPRPTGWRGCAWATRSARQTSLRR